MCIGENLTWSYVKKFLKIWTLRESPIPRKTKYHLPAQLKASIKEHPYLTSVTVSLKSVRPKKRLLDLFDAPKSFNQKEEVPEEKLWVCRWADGTGIKKDEQKHYWENYASQDDDEFPCAFDTNKKHHINENIYHHAKRALQCEFDEIKITGGGDCGFSALFSAFMTDPQCHFRLMRDDKPLSVKGLKTEIVKMIMGKCDEETMNEIKAVWGYFRNKKDSKNETDYSQLYGALDRNKDEKSRKDTLESGIYAKGMWLDEAIVILIEQIYNIRILLVKSYAMGRVAD